jgi:hypothetical protein
LKSFSKNNFANKTRGCGHNVALPFTLKKQKKYLKAKEELWKIKYFTMQKYII